MKNTHFILFFIALFNYGNAQLQNGDFEQWDEPTMEILHNPTAWVSHSGIMATPYMGFIHPRQTDAQNNDYALKLSVYYNYAKNAAIQTAAIDYKPAHLKGFYKYENNAISGPDGMISDTAMVVVHLTKFNISTGQRDTIGSGSVSLNQSDNYTAFDVNIAYTNNDVPDSIHVYLDPSLANRYQGRYYVNPNEPESSFFTVDNLSLEGEAVLSTDDVNKDSSILIYPNPATDRLYIQGFEGTAAVYDIAGKQVLSQKIMNANAMDIAALSTGTYQVHLMEGENKQVVKFIKQ